MNFRFEGGEANVLVQDTPVWPDANNPQTGNVLQVVLDNSTTSTVTLIRHQQRYRVASGLPAGTHEVRLVKRTEALVGDLQFVGVELPEDGTLLAPSAAPERRLELIGDSVTAGYGNEAPDETHPFRPETENAALTYGALAGRALAADTRLIAWSGRGVYRNFDGSTADTMSDLYLRTLPREEDSAWTFTNWTPQVVVINLGVNDFAVDTPSRDAFCASYSNLVNTVRAHYVDPHIFCCVSSTPNDSWPAGQMRRTTLRTWLTDLVGGYVAQGQTRTYFLEFAEQQPADGYGADFHPSLATHLKMAGQLYTSVVQQVGW
jgi:lysophospholipase L1-like esterase